MLGVIKHIPRLPKTSAYTSQLRNPCFKGRAMGTILDDLEAISWPRKAIMMTLNKTLHS